MKNSCLIAGVLCVLALPTLLHSQDATRVADESSLHVANPRSPWREIGGMTNYIETDGVKFCGKVVDVTTDGVIIHGSYGQLSCTTYYQDLDDRGLVDYKDFFVAHFPFEVVNDQIISPDELLLAWSVGTYTYTTVSGGSRTIRKLDYGIPCGPPPPTKEQIEAAQAKTIADRQRILEVQTNAVIWLQSQAKNGSADMQCDLGEHYLDGRGCATNVDLGVYWLKKSAAQGNTEASNKLASLNIR